MSRFYAIVKSICTKKTNILLFLHHSAQLFSQVNFPIGQKTDLNNFMVGIVLNFLLCKIRRDSLFPQGKKGASGNVMEFVHIVVKITTNSENNKYTYISDDFR